MRNKYNLYDNGVLVGTYNAKEISEICGISYKRVLKPTNIKHVYQDRYTYERVYDLDEDDNSYQFDIDDKEIWKMEWDEVRNSILNYKKKKNKINKRDKIIINY